jgi:glycosyltransferase involved in cell wall biosynthesis
MFKASYVLVTAARNEERFIRKTIDSVTTQTVLPQKWVIVSDGSTDRTEDIVNQEAATHTWIELVCMPRLASRQFSNSALCLNLGYQRVKNQEFDIIGFLDADISFEKDYFEFLISKFLKFPRLGVAGTPYLEGEYDISKNIFYDRQHVHGACQCFRRKCFEEIGGFIPIQIGGYDKVAVTISRINGWETRSFDENKFVHHRRIGFGGQNILSVRLKYGHKDYILGNHPLWEIFRAIYQMVHKPYFVGGLLLLIGYFFSLLSRKKRPVPAEYIAFHRQEEIRKLKSIFRRFLR